MRTFVFGIICAMVSSATAAMLSTITLIEYPSLKERFRVESPFEELCGTDELNGLFYTHEQQYPYTGVGWFRCYDCNRGFLWSKDFPEHLLHIPFGCVGTKVYVSDKTQGVVKCYDLDNPQLEPKVIGCNDAEDVKCVYIAGYGDGRIVCFFSQEPGSRFETDIMSAVVIDAASSRIVHKINFSNQEERDRVLSGRIERRCYNSSLRLIKSTKDGCLFYDKGRCVAKVSREEIERRLTGYQDFFGDLTYDCEIFPSDKAIFYNIIGYWFLFDIRKNTVVESGRVDLDRDDNNELLHSVVSENCFCVRVKRSFLARLFWKGFRPYRYELVELRNGVQCRKKLPLEYMGFHRFAKDVWVTYTAYDD